jgi:hypothetical protein
MPDGRVEAQPLEISEEKLFNLEDKVLVFFTRSSPSVNFISSRVRSCSDGPVAKGLGTAMYSGAYDYRPS